MRAFPGYTIRTLDEEDTHRILTLRDLLDPDLGKA